MAPWIVPFMKLIIVFGCMLAGMRFKLGLGFSVLLGSVLLMPLFGVGLGSWFVAAWNALTGEKTLFLVAIVATIMALSKLLEITGQAERLMDTLGERFHRPSLALMFFPALIGLLPMPGGAVFSAPMLKSVADRLQRANPEMIPPSGERLAAINYWFRHIWELGWPLYPGIILASSLADVPIVKLAFFGIPVCLVVFTAGWFFIMRFSLGKASDTAQATQTAPWRAVAWQGLPLLIAIIGALGLEGGLAWSDLSIPYEYGVVAALILAVACVAWQNSLGARKVFSTLRSKHMKQMLLLILAIFVFKESLDTAGVVGQLSSVASGSLALYAAAILLPFLVGMISGITIGFVGPTFPLLLAMLAGAGETNVLPWVILGLASGFAGVMISPIHICFILTCQYFQVPVATVWRRLVMPSLAVLVFGLLYFNLLQLF